MDRPIILIMTDSVSLPRRYPPNQEVRWNKIYVNLLRKEFSEFEFVHVAFGGATIGDLRSQVNYYRILKPNIVIIQCGIVDCTPRAFGRIELELIKKFHLFRFTKLLVKPLRKYRKHQYTKKRKFEGILVELKKILKAEHFISIGIIPGCHDYDLKAPGISERIEQYNAILKKHSVFIDLSKIPREGLLEDHHHINEIGHNHIFTQLRQKLDELKLPIFGERQENV